MSTEYVCDACGNRYVIDDVHDLDELSCPACAATIKIGPIPTTNKEVEPDVVCPRCNLHFSPRSTADAASPDSPGHDTLPTVLVVEDMLYFREIARDALAGQYDVRLATTVAEAQAEIERGGIDLIVLDLTLDGADHGIDLLTGLPFKPCPILLYTAQDESEMYGEPWAELQRLGVDDVVLKGMQVGETLLRKVDRLLGKQDDGEELVTNTVVSR